MVSGVQLNKEGRAVLLSRSRPCRRCSHPEEKAMETLRALSIFVLGLEDCSAIPQRLIQGRL